MSLILSQNVPDVVDSAEDNDMVEWYEWSGTNPKLAPAQPAINYVHGDYVIDASGSARAATADGGTNSGGLNNYPEAGTTWEYYVYSGSADAHSVCYFGFPAGEDGQPFENSLEYRVQFSSNDTVLESNNSTVGDSTYTSSAVTFSTNSWYRVVVYWGDPPENPTTAWVAVEIYDFDASTNTTGTLLATDSANPDVDHDWTNRSLAFLSGGFSGACYIDYINRRNDTADP